jgi:putative ABC transport system permease protein
MKSTASFGEAASVAWKSLRSSKLRSFLTLLGIILATTTLIAVMSVINGMNVYIAQEVSDMGVDGYRVHRVVMLGENNPKKWLELNKKNPQLSPDEYDFLKSHLNLTRELGMQAERGVTVKYGAQALDWIELDGVSPNMAVISSVQVAQGRFITDADDRRRLEVAFIGNDIRDKFFPSSDPVGKTILVQGRPFEIIGVAKAQGSVFGQSKDKFLMIPIQTYIKQWSSRQGLAFAGLALDRDHLEQAQEEMRVTLRAVRHLKPGQDDNFGLIASDSLVALWDRITGAIAATAVAVVSVFMVVGGVVIMNIMLAVVTERTHEIGIRKSVGARRVDILNQFLVESSMLAAFGGFTGVALAWLVALIVRNATPVPMQLPLSAIIVGVGLSTLVGLFFGIYPARQASKLDPIEALRHEN